MTVARSQQVSLADTPYYHCVIRCMRRAFLCGKDHYSGRNYEHRRGWIEEKVLAMQSVFCIDVCAYAVMSNHYHVVLHVDYQVAKALSAKEVVDRWLSLFKGSVLMQRFQQSDDLSQAELDAVGLVVEEWRSRLSDISWFMRCCNEWLDANQIKRITARGAFGRGGLKARPYLMKRHSLPAWPM